MSRNLRTLLVAGIGWYVFFDVILRTSGSAAAAISTTYNIFQNLQYGIRNTGTFNIYGGIALAITITLSVIVITLILRLWSYLVQFTQQLAEAVLEYNGEAETSDTSQVSQDGEAVSALLGKRSPIWRFLRLLALTWGIVLFLQFATNLLALFAIS